jgi:putative colanic acid biosynthesis acetyltransferase WcaF
MATMQHEQAGKPLHTSPDPPGVSADSAPRAHGQATGPSPRPGAIFQRLDRTAGFPYTPREYLRRFLWEWTQRTLIRFSPRRAHGWRRFWLRRFGARIPDSSGTKSTTKIFHPWLLTMGESALLGENVTVYNLGPVEIGTQTIVSQDAYLCAGTHDYTKANLPLLRPTIRIGSGVWVCAGAFIGPGVVVGNNAVVGARAVVTTDVPEGMIVGGNPARVIKARRMEWDPEMHGNNLA